VNSELGGLLPSAHRLLHTPLPFFQNFSTFGSSAPSTHLKNGPEKHVFDEKEAKHGPCGKTITHQKPGTEYEP
jgi:hypothetical protein